MQLFWNRKKKGWTALRMVGDGICRVHVERRNGDKPLVTDWSCAQQAEGDLRGMDQKSLRRQRAVALLERNEYQVLQVEALTVPREEWRQAIRWSIKDMLDYPVANATVDVLEIPADTSNPSRPRYMLAVAARQEAIRRRIERHLEQTSMGLEAIDIPETAQRNVAALLEQAGRGLALLTFGPEGGLLTLTSGGELYHARQIDASLDLLQHPEEDRRHHVYERVGLDLQRSLDNFERQFPYLAVNRLVVAPFPRREDFIAFLRGYLYLQVESFELTDLFDVSQVPELLDPSQQARALPLLGAALREEVGR